MAEQDSNAGDNGNSESNGSGNGSSILDALKTKELLLPAALSAVGAVAAAKGPGLVRRLSESTEKKGEESAQRLGEKAAEGAKSQLTGGKGMLGKVASKALPGGGGGGGGQKKTRRLPIQRWTDVAVSVETAYEAWNNFDQYPKFMHRVLSVRREGDDKVRWQEKIWFSKRNWEGRITDRRKNDRIAWKTTSGMSHYGVVTFHRLDDELTRVMVDMEFEPTGMMEKMASGLRFVKRAVQADLARFKAYVEMKDAKGIDYRPTGSNEKDKDKDKEQDNDQKSGDDREDERRDRESRRKERQGAEASS
jgi:hypothetical protein